MTATLESIRKEARKLPLEKREALVRVLEQDLDQSVSSKTAQAAEADIEKDWDRVIADRVKEIEGGKATLIPFDQVEAEMDAFVASLKGA
jgi:hypothetical protein